MNVLKSFVGYNRKEERVTYCFVVVEGENGRTIYRRNGQAYRYANGRMIRILGRKQVVLLTACTPVN